MDNKKNSEAKIRANAKYNAKTYKRYTINIRKSDSVVIDDYIQVHNLSNSKFFELAVKYCIKNNIELDELQQEDWYNIFKLL